MNRQYRILILGVATTLLACTESFDSKGGHEPQLVVYSVMTAQTDTQLVRVYSTYDPPAYNPLDVVTDNPVTDAQVSISRGGQTYGLRDTLITRIDKTRFASDIRAFVANPLTVQPGTVYTLSINSPTRGTITASTTVPDKALMLLVNSFAVVSPSLFTDQDISLQITLSRHTKGYLLRLYLAYEYTSGSITYTKWSEVPSSIRTIGTETIESFPRLVRRTSASTATSAGRETASIPNQAYRHAINKIKSQYGGLNLKFLSAIFILSQVETNFYNYYNVANGFQDQFSIRTDEPDYSSIKGGVGVFGGMVNDTLVMSLPAFIN